jgi:hypothetical protein
VPREKGRLDGLASSIVEYVSSLLRIPSTSMCLPLCLLLSTKLIKNLVVVIHPYDRTRPTNSNLCAAPYKEKTKNRIAVL